jgi:hypothetical protein
MIIEQDKLKELLELSLNCGRQMQSPQTGYVHYYYHSQISDVQHTIPILENVLFALSLLRSRLVENANEAKGILSRLLIFQDETKGNFPMYVHHFPECQDNFLGLSLLAPFYWILKQFGHVLGQELRSNLEATVKAILAHSLQLQPPYAFAMRLAAARCAFGQLWSDAALIQLGTEQLNELQARGHVDEWHKTRHLSHMLIALQMVYPSIKNSPWKDFWHYLEQTWHQQACSYVGPCLSEEQRGEEPEVSLYDLFLGYFSKQLAARSKLVHPCQLHAALIQSSDDQLEFVTGNVKGQHANQAWMLWHKKEWACTLLDKKELLNSTLEHSYTFLRFVWGNASRTHTLVCQGSIAKVEYEANFPHVTLILHLEKEVDAENREKQKEINFYLDFHPEAKIKVDQQASSTFELGQLVTIESEQRKLDLTFEQIEGKGQFLGHLMRGNRPCQMSAKGEERFKAHDWHLLLRTIRRAGKCVIKAQINLIS